MVSGSWANRRLNKADTRQISAAHAIRVKYDELNPLPPNPTVLRDVNTAHPAVLNRSAAPAVMSSGTKVEVRTKDRIRQAMLESPVRIPMDKAAFQREMHHVSQNSTIDPK